MTPPCSARSPHLCPPVPSPWPHRVPHPGPAGSLTLAPPGPSPWPHRVPSPRDGKRTVCRPHLDQIPAICHLSMPRAGRSPRGGRGVGGQQESGTGTPPRDGKRTVCRPQLDQIPAICHLPVLRGGRGVGGQQQSGTGTPPRDGKRTVCRPQLDPIAAICNLSMLRRGAVPRPGRGAEGRRCRVPGPVPRGGGDVGSQQESGTGTPSRDGKRTVCRPQLDLSLIHI